MSTQRALLLVMAGAALALQVGATLLGSLQGYGYFIDELYYVACAKRLAWGYVDHPPLAPAILRLVLAVAGDSLVAIRLPSALAGAATVLLTGWLAGRLGGGGFATALSAMAALAAPVFLVFFNFFSMNSLEVLLWTACLVVAVVMVERNEPRLWILFGAIAGTALETKHTVVLLAGAILFGLVLTPERRLLGSRWLFVGGAVALLLFLPNLWWQVEHDFASVDFYRNATLFKNRPLPALQILWNQALFMSPWTVPLWGAGLCFTFRTAPRLRFVALAYLLLLGTLVVSQSSRPDRIAGIYPVLFATGAVAVERVLRSSTARALALGGFAIGSTVLAPLFLPLLPPDRVASYLGALGIDTQIERGEGKRAEVPQWLADRIGWEKLVADLRAVYRSLPPEERRSATILAPSYGHAGAIELLGRGELPPVLSPHNTYHLWGKRSVDRLSRGVAISVGYDADDLSPLYDSVERVAIHECGYCMPWRDGMGIYVARGPKLSPDGLRSLWENLRHFE